MQLLEIGATHCRTSLKALSLAQSQNNSEAKEAPGSPTALDLSDPTRAIEELGSFNAGFPQTIAKTGNDSRVAETITDTASVPRSNIVFQDFVVGDHTITHNWCAEGDCRLSIGEGVT